MFGRNVPSLLISLAIHTVLLGSMALYRYGTFDTAMPAIETIIAEDRTQPEFEQDLNVDTTVSQTLSAQAGGAVANALDASSSSATASAKIEASEALKYPETALISLRDVSVPMLSQVAAELEHGEYVGVTGARVPGYTAAMSRMTNELMRMMRSQPVVVVWMFDASLSLKDDRQEIADNFSKIYEELGLAQEQAASRNMRYAPLETMTVSFGADVKRLLPQPTADVEAIRESILNIPIDTSGEEHTFGAISRIVDEFSTITGRTNRKLVIVVLTDETGDDDSVLEELIVKTQRARSPIYFFGREAVFGYPTAYESWTDPEPPNLVHWVDVDRGPETAFPENLQYDGLHGRYDSASSGFGPYGQVRLSKLSGGIFFLLAGDEEDLAGNQLSDARKYHDLMMREYEPLLLSRREYEEARNQSEFRNAIWQVIVSLNPHLDQLLNLQQHHYPTDAAAFHQAKNEQFSRCVRSLAKLNEAILRLEEVREQRSLESSARWRASYDLCLAQLYAYRVRQFQFLLRLDQHAKANPRLSDPKSNRWDLELTHELLPPDEQQIKATKVNLEEIESQRKKALEMYELVIREHPGTPWARRAAQEREWGFGFRFQDNYWNPAYSDPVYQQRVPKL